MSNINNKPIDNEKLKAFMEKLREAVKKYHEKQEKQKTALEQLLQKRQ